MVTSPPSCYEGYVHTSDTVLIPGGRTRVGNPVGAYPPNGYGLHDMIGNVWEWTRTPWTHSHDSADPDQTTAACCGGARHRPTEGERFVVKGGSHLCSPDYCHRYRPAARPGHGANDTTSHVGFRCVQRI